jgi:hypothetical protein
MAHGTRYDSLFLFPGVCIHYFLWPLCQQMSALGPANTVAESSPFKGANELLKVFHRNVLPLGNFANLDWRLVTMAS